MSNSALNDSEKAAEVHEKYVANSEVITELRSILYEEYGQKVTQDEAADLGIALVELIKSLTKPDAYECQSERTND